MNISTEGRIPKKHEEVPPYTQEDMVKKAIAAGVGAIFVLIVLLFKLIPIYF